MTLSDREILELNELCSAVVDGTLSEAQRGRLSRWLGESEAARRYYVRAMAQSASLHAYAAELHAGAPDLPRRWRPAIHVPRWVWGSLAAAVAIALVFFVLRPGARREDGATGRQAEDFVAQITGAKDAQWRGEAKGLQPGASLHRGQRIELRAGLAEITFDSGARVVLEGAASFEVNSAWEATLRRGALKASVPPEAVGFRVSNPAVEVVDLGTEFTMIADGKGGADVLVLKGEVEAAPRGALDPDTIRLREKESRRFAASGVSDVQDREEKFARFAGPLPLERFTPGISYVHWSFDEAEGDMANAEVAGPAIRAAEVGLKLGNTASLAGVRTEGVRGSGRALRFDGQLQARGAFPGLSGSGPRTIAFWVKVPEEAPLSDAYAMIAWATQLPKLGSRPVQISWNRRPAEGPMGALRTDFGGGNAMGTTSLRDGKWHHVAVYFSAGDDPAAPVQVKQYVDGRLESSSIVPGTTRAPAGRGDAALVDVVWLGCRLTGQTRREHFRGEMDELFIADRALEPNEIVALMKHNRPPAAAFAVTP
jgi:ferric-dicitrate binding protein FerR (iron transport regulator)